MKECDNYVTYSIENLNHHTNFIGGKTVCD